MSVLFPIIFMTVQVIAAVCTAILSIVGTIWVIRELWGAK
jgi:hypothetical protein